MSNDHDRRRDLSKLRTIPLDDATHRRLRLYAHGLHEPGEAGETIARVAGEAISEHIDRQEGRDPVAVALGFARLPGEAVADAVRRVVAERDRWADQVALINTRTEYGAKPEALAGAMEEAGDPSEGAGELYGRWRR